MDLPQHRLLCAILLTVLIPQSLPGEWDTGTSQNLIIRKNLTEPWYFISRNNFATRNGEEIFLAYVDGNLGRRLGNGWSAEMGYRHFWLKRQSWSEEYRPHANLSWRGKVGEFTVSNRHRLELRFPDGGNDRFRYRNETRIQAPSPIPGTSLRPFLEEEFFYEFTSAGFNQNWLTVGVTFPLREGATVKLGYRWHTQKFGNTWRNRHVLATGLLLFF